MSDNGRRQEKWIHLFQKIFFSFAQLGIFIPSFLSIILSQFMFAQLKGNWGVCWSTTLVLDRNSQIVGIFWCAKVGQWFSGFVSLLNYRTKVQISNNTWFNGYLDTQLTVRFQMLQTEVWLQIIEFPLHYLQLLKHPNSRKPIAADERIRLNIVVYYQILWGSSASSESQ